MRSDEHHAFNEDVSRILLGEAPSWRGLRAEEVVRQARPLVEELAELARGAGGGPEQALARAGQIASTLSGIFDLSARKPAR
jgi:hypothetical protein